MNSRSIARHVQKGFTLIELMIVVAIIGILGAVALPKYQDHVVKAKLASAMASVESLRTAVGLAIQETGGTTGVGNASSSTTMVPAFTPTNEVSDATVTNGVIVATLRNIGAGIDGTTITWTPNIGSSNVTWTVQSSIAAGATGSALQAKNVIEKGSATSTTTPATSTGG